MVIPTMKAIIRLLEFKMCLFMFLLHTVLYLTITEIRVYKHSTCCFSSLFILKLGNTTLILYKDDLEFVSEFPCLLGHPVLSMVQKY